MIVRQQPVKIINVLDINVLTSAKAAVKRRRRWRDVMLATVPVSWWEFNEGSGDAIDTMGFQNGSVNGATYLSDGVIVGEQTKGLFFDGDNVDNVNMQNPSGTWTAAPFTLMAVGRHDRLASSVGYTNNWCLCADMPPNSYSLSVGSTNDKVFFTCFDTVQNKISAVSIDPIRIQVPMICFGTLDAPSGTCWLWHDGVRGVPTPSNEFGATSLQTGTTLRIGGAAGNEQMMGTIDDFAFWSRVLTDGEIADLTLASQGKLFIRT